MDILREVMSMDSVSWEQAKAAAEAGTLNEILHSRDRIPVTLKNGEEIVLVVTYDQTGKAYFVFEDCVAEPHYMNESYTNKGGWAASDMRCHLREDIFPLLPDDLQAVIASTRIVQIVGGERVECEDKLFLLSKTQVFGNGPWSANEPEDSHLDIFKRERERVKERAGWGTEWWWLRSPEAPGSVAFASVFHNGSSNNYAALHSFGVAPGFCL